MSTLKVNDIEEATSGGGKFDVARAWVNYTCVTTTSIRDDKGVSSLTDNYTGSTTVTLSNAMGNVNYAVATGGHQSSSFNYADGMGSHAFINATSNFTQSGRQTQYESGSNRDFHTLTAVVHGDS